MWLIRQPPRIHYFHVFLPAAPPAWDASIGNSIKRAPDREGHWHNQGCSKHPRSNSLSGCEHHDDDRPPCRRPPSLASVSSSRVGRKGRCVSHSITSSAAVSGGDGTGRPSLVAV